MFFLKFSSNQPKISLQLNQHTGVLFWFFVLNRPVTPFAINIPQLKTELPLPSTTISIILWKRANLTPIYTGTRLLIVLVLLAFQTASLKAHSFCSIFNKILLKQMVNSLVTEDNITMPTHHNKKNPHAI